MPNRHSQALNPRSTDRFSASVQYHDTLRKHTGQERTTGDGGQCTSHSIDGEAPDGVSGNIADGAFCRVREFPTRVEREVTGKYAGLKRTSGYCRERASSGVDGECKDNSGFIGRRAI